MSGLSYSNRILCLLRGTIVVPFFVGGAWTADASTKFCQQLGEKERAFVEASDDASLKALAADVVVQTRQGPWQLKAAWTGCESYLFIHDAARQNSRFPVSIFDRDIPELLEASPQNVHYFFSSGASDAAERREVLDGLKAKMDLALGALTPKAKSDWLRRLHYVDEDLTARADWLGQNMRDPAWGVAIDRSQRIRYIGSYADVTRWNESIGWFEPNLAYAANEAVYYNFEAAREERLAAQASTGVVITALDHVPVKTGWGGKPYVFEVDLPTQVEMSRFDTLELDFATDCGGAGERGHCPAWDRIINLYLCDDKNDPESCKTEMGRWITTYHREGRWVHDVSPLLPLIAKGGRLAFGVLTVDEWYLTLRFRLNARAKGLVASEATYLWGGQPFNLDYNSRFEPKEVLIPADAKKVEIAYVMTGHGMSGEQNCAEFCDAVHYFNVNQKDYLVRTPPAGTLRGCEEDVVNGTVPNQYGTWFYGRSNWCPGKEVPVKTIDVTEVIHRGQKAHLSYRGFGPDHLPFDKGDAWAEIVLNSWLVIYR